MEILNKRIPPWDIERLGKDEVPDYEKLRGKPLLILFFYLGCPGCTGRAIPFANKMAYEYTDKINIIGIHSNFEGPEYNDDDIVEKLKSLYVRFPVFKDSGLASTFYKYQAAGTPHWILVNREGNVIRTIFGSDPNRALLRLDYALTEELSSFD